MIDPDDIDEIRNEKALLDKIVKSQYDRIQELNRRIEVLVDEVEYYKSLSMMKGD